MRRTRSTYDTALAIGPFTVPHDDQPQAAAVERGAVQPAVLRARVVRGCRPSAGGGEQTAASTCASMSAADGELMRNAGKSVCSRRTERTIVRRVPAAERGDVGVPGGRKIGAHAPGRAGCLHDRSPSLRTSASSCEDARVAHVAKRRCGPSASRRIAAASARNRFALHGPGGTAALGSRRPARSRTRARRATGSSVLGNAGHAQRQRGDKLVAVAHDQDRPAARRVRQEGAQPGPRQEHLREGIGAVQPLPALAFGVESSRLSGSRESRGGPHVSAKASRICCYPTSRPRGGDDSFGGAGARAELAVERGVAPRLRVDVELRGRMRERRRRRAPRRGADRSSASRSASATAAAVKSLAISP